MVGDTNPATLASDSIDHDGPNGLKDWDEIMAATWATRETLRREVQG